MRIKGVANLLEAPLALCGLELHGSFHCPVPASEKLGVNCVPPEPYVTIRVATRAPVAVGLKVIGTVQFAPAARLLPHCVV